MQPTRRALVVDDDPDRRHAIHDERFGGLPILAIAADGSAPQKVQRVGAYKYLRKPFELDELLTMVARGLSG